MRLLISMGCLLATLFVTAAANPPNIVFFLADDLGYGDLGSFGQKKIQTPNLDQLAKSGMRLTQHYSGSPVCASSRCVLMTGLHPGHAVIRSNKEIRPEGQHPLPAGTKTVARLLQKHGYVTGGFGKWGLGGPGTAGEPLNQGFNRFYGYNCQREAHNFYPTFLWSDRTRITLNNPRFRAHQKFDPKADPNDPKSYARYAGKDYAPDYITEAAVQFVKANKDKPFFLYYPTTVPHLALQVPEDSLKDYVGKWPDKPYLGNAAYLPHFTPRAAYAAMITRMDRDIGRIITLIRDLGLEKNTIFVFSSDNGPLWRRFGGTDTTFFNSNAGMRGRKGSLYEGGVRVPTIVSWKGRIKAGSESDRVTGFEDWLPTLLEMVGAPSLTPKDSDGISFARTLFGKRQKPRPFLYREFPSYGGQQSLRMGNWKAVRQNLVPKEGTDDKPRMHVELYDLSKDPNETRDISADHADLVTSMKQIMREQRVASKLFPIPALDGN